MTETQKRIKAYKEALPGLRERVAAVALLLIISMTMVTAASFAWVSLSTHPELSGVATTVTANGNLEIALVPTNGVEPGASMIGDSSAAEGQTITGANITWGNLINLSDPAYGLDYLVLRPAMLRDSKDLLSNPLISVNYGEDGRVETTYNEDFRYTNWNAERQFFEYNTENKYGVRAISTIEFKVQDSSYAEYRALDALIGTAERKLESEYNQLLYKDGVKNNGPSANINALAGLIGAYLTGNLNDTPDAEVDVTAYVEDMYNLMVMFRDLYDTSAEILTAMANVQVYMKHGITNYKSYVYTAETLLAATTEELAANGVTLDSLDDFKDDMTQLDDLVAQMKVYNDKVVNDTSATVSWADIKDIVNTMVDIPSCLVNGKRVSSIGVSAALEILGADEVLAVIQNGLIKDFEQMTGMRMDVGGVTVSVYYMWQQSLEADSITTNATEPSDFETDRDKYCSASGMDTLMEGSAQDTYGLAVDLWVRTNSPNSYLILEGNVLTEESIVQATGKDPDGNTVNLYSATITYKADTETDPDAVDTEVEVELYQIDGVWYFADNHLAAYNEDDTLTRGDEMTEPMAKMVTISTVIGYEGENRIWDNNALLTVNSTTQGSGSCYVFYSDNPTDQANSLKLLSNMRVGFVDADGKLIAQAKLDTDNYYAASGKVTVPLKLMYDSSSPYYTKVDSETVITALEQNVATRITAIVYLEGTNLTNDQVLAASEIQGKLNIQFGSTNELIAIGDEALENAELHVSAELTGEDEFDYDTATGPMTTSVKVTVDGDSPSTVKAFFIRQVNATQGSREAVMNFTETSSGVWEADYTFQVPGTYVLRSVQLDGQEHDLSNDPPITVTVKGFALSSVNCSACVAGGTASIMTGDKSVSTSVSVKFASDDPAKMPKAVEVQFVSNEGGNPVYAKLNYNTTTTAWEGTATFTSTGNYTMRYVIMDGNYTELAEDQQCTLDITLGIQVRIRDDQTTTEYIYEGETVNIGIVADIYDETGEKLVALQDAVLYYSKEGSVLEGMDTDLTWNATGQNYTGTFYLKEPGIYAFDRLTIGTNAVRNTVGETPVYTSISPDPPVYMGSVDWKDYQFAPNYDASVTLRIQYVESATVYAVFDNLDTAEVESIKVLGTKMAYDAADKIYDVTFKLPVTNSNVSYQDGKWQITSLELKGVCDESGKYYGPSETAAPLVWERTAITEEDLISQVATAKINISYQNGAAVDYEGAFMDSFTNEGEIYITLTDQLGRPLEVSFGSGTIEYTHLTGTNVTYGGYSGGTLDGAGTDEVYTLNLTALADGSGYKLAANALTMPYAGEYKATKLDFVLDGMKYHYGTGTVENGINDLNVPSGTPLFTVTTTVPSVTITGITPSGENSVDTSNSGVEDYTTNTGGWWPTYTWHTHSSHVYASGTPYVSEITNAGTDATVYFKCGHSDVASTGSSNLAGIMFYVEYHNYTQPTVTITLADMGNATGAELAFNSNYLYESSGGTTTSQYSWTADGTCRRYIGGYVSVSAGSDEKTPAGTITASQLTMTHGGQTYYFTIPTITINNPY